MKRANRSRNFILKSASGDGFPLTVAVTLALLLLFIAASEYFLSKRFPLPYSRFIEYALKESALGKLLFWTKGEERRGVLIGLYRLSSLKRVQRLSQATRLHHGSGLLGTCDAKVRGRSQQLKTGEAIKVESLTDRKKCVGSRPVHAKMQQVHGIYTCGTCFKEAARARHRSRRL